MLGGAPARASHLLAAHCHICCCACHAQVLGLVGCGRKRLLLLWAALEVAHGGTSSTSAASASASGQPGDKLPPVPSAGAPMAADASVMLRLSLRSLEPPPYPRQQVLRGQQGRLRCMRFVPGMHMTWRTPVAARSMHQHMRAHLLLLLPTQDAADLPSVHWSLKRFINWQLQHMARAAAQAQQHRVSQPGAGAAAASAAAATNLAQQHFQHLLGPRLQLLAPAQADRLRSYLQQTTRTARDDGADAPGGGRPLLNSSSLNPLPWQRPWDTVQVALLEGMVGVAKAANAPAEVWEAAAALLRCVRCQQHVQ